MASNSNIAAETFTEALQNFALDDISHEIFSIFQEEVQDHLQAIQQQLVDQSHQQQAPLPTPLRQEWQRRFHTLKGAAGAVGFKPIAQLLHSLEQQLEQPGWSQQPAAPLLELIFATTEQLQQLLQGILHKESLLHLKQQLDHLAPTLSPNSPSPPSDPVTKGETPAAPDADMPQQNNTLRISIDRLDELETLAGDMVVCRNTMEEQLRQLTQVAADIQRCQRKLQEEFAAWERQISTPSLPAREATPKADQDGATKWDPLEFDNYPKWHSYQHQLTETLHLQGQRYTELQHLLGDLQQHNSRQSSYIRQLQEKLTRIRLVPLKELHPRLHRVAQQTAQQLGKQVHFILDDHGVEMDKNVLNKLADPLGHAVRNAVVHGIETPENRTQCHKAAQGTVKLQAAYEGNRIELKLIDDGAGLDYQKIAQRAQELGWLHSEMQTEPEQLQEFVFQPGFSTTAQADTHSGRGVGMDVLAHQVQQLQGQIHLSSDSGQGTEIDITLPMTLALMRGLLVKARSQCFALPSNQLQRILRRSDSQGVHHFAGQDYVKLAEGQFPLIDLGEHLQLPAAESASPQGVALILIQGGQANYVLQCDEILGLKELVVKNLGPHLRNLESLSGATVLGDGSLALILNPQGLQPAIATGQDPQAHESPPPEPSASIMVVDDSRTVRSSVCRCLEKAHWQTIAAQDGQEAWEILQQLAHNPALLILDIEMPRLDGYSLLERLRQSEPFQQLPVLMLTSRSGDKHRQEAFAKGAQGYLAKPYTEAALWQQVHKLTAIPEGYTL